MSSTPVSMQQLIDAGTDCGTIASIATSTAESVVDRLGHTKLTMVGACNKIGFEQATTYSTGGQTLLRPTQTVYYSGLIYAPAYGTLYPFVTSGAFNTSLWRVIDTDVQKVLDNTQVYNVAALRIFTAFTNNQQIYLEGHTTLADGGQGVFYWSASSTASDNDGTVIKVASVTSGRWVRNCALNDLHADWFGPVVILDDVINALPSTGGVVRLSAKRYKPSGYFYGGSASGKFIGKDSVSIIGVKVPEFHPSCMRLENGSIIEGMVLAYANNLSFSDLGIDVGNDVINYYYGGVVTGVEGLLVTYPNDAVKGAQETRVNISYENIRVLALSPTSMQHCFIMGEGVNGIKFKGIIETCYGIYGAVIKGANVVGDSISCYANTWDGMIIKSDVQTSARATSVKINSLSLSLYPPTPAAYISPTVAAGNSLRFQAAGSNVLGIQIGKISTFGHVTGVNFQVDGLNTIDGVSIESIISESNSVNAVSIKSNVGQIIKKVKIGSVISNNTPIPVDINMSSTSSVEIESVFATITVVAAQIGGAGIPKLGYVSNDYGTEAVFRILSGSKFLLDSCAAAGVPSFYSKVNGGTSWALNTGVTSIGNFRCELFGSAARISGTVTPSASSWICTLPKWLTPPVNCSFFAMGKNGAGTYSAVPVLIEASTGKIIVNDGGGTANCSASLSFDNTSFSVV